MRAPACRNGSKRLTSRWRRSSSFVTSENCSAPTQVAHVRVVQRAVAVRGHFHVRRRNEALGHEFADGFRIRAGRPVAEMLVLRNTQSLPLTTRTGRRRPACSRLALTAMVRGLATAAANDFT
jgi:hypothetical protein